MFIIGTELSQLFLKQLRDLVAVKRMGLNIRMHHEQECGEELRRLSATFDHWAGCHCLG